MFQKKGVGTRQLVFLAASLDYYTIPPATKAIKHYFNVRFFYLSDLCHQLVLSLEILDRL